MGSGVFENVQPIANVNGIYQPVVDDGIGPEQSLIVPAVCPLAQAGSSLAIEAGAVAGIDGTKNPA